MPQLITIPLVGHAPDLDPSTPGVFSYCNGVESTSRGWRLVRGLTVSGTTTAQLAAGSYVLNASVADIANGTEARHLALYDANASKYKLYADIGGTLTDKSAGGNYNASTESFSFCQYGNYTLATNLLDAVQYRDASTTNSFAVTGATNIPKAKINVTWGPPTAQMVMLLDYNDGTAYRNGYWNSSLGGPLASWGPVAADGSQSGQLAGAGIIRCGIAYRDDLIVFGDRQMWIARYVGGSIPVEWTRITDELGCVGIEAAKVINGVLYFIGDQGLFTYDGTFPRKAQFPIQSELISTLAGLGTSKKLTQVIADGTGQRLQIALRANAYGTTQSITKWYLINLLNGRVSLRGSASTSSLNIDLVMDRKYVVVCAVTGAAADFIYIQVEGSTPYAASLSDAYGFGLNYLGNDHEDTKLLGLYPRFITAPSTFSGNDYFGPTMSEALGSNTGATTVSASPWRYDVTKAARWHAPRLLFSSNGTVDGEVVDVMLSVAKAGAS